ncbi:Diphthine--ammonia ligase [Golovinomyces cichoracearum]|uniref:Diphthine--ammonia ligase n=1 Tax=Golovinomyces cichoracearum TaxID=62708 RepID=A0A420IUK2_9PEZI|nr:Diphthine--ammonia ligase [Golovinomyces cichoracearum]
MNQTGIPESLDVIALISGGKDSFFSILQCINLGHRVIALANLYPPYHDGLSVGEKVRDSDLNSFMYQTVGHTVIPLYEEALGIPLYREPILGTAIHSGTSYGEDNNEYPNSTSELSLPHDETECMVPLLRRIMREHPNANALCSGAIYSTYQRTRVEAIACRLGLISLAYLWQYPKLPLKNSISLLEDMRDAELDARIIKVAGSELDQSFLWQNLMTETTVRRVQKVIGKFGMVDDGAVLGEGGEFETLVLNGPSHLFKGRIEIQDSDKKVIRESGGSAWLEILRAKVVMKNSKKRSLEVMRIPDLFDQKFKTIMEALNDLSTPNISLSSKDQNAVQVNEFPILTQNPKISHVPFPTMAQWTIAASEEFTSVKEEALHLRDKICLRLDKERLSSFDIISTIILLRSMQDFEDINKVYGTLFSRPNPPARVTISCGENMPRKTNLIFHLTVRLPSSLNQTSRKALHVQSHSYWAPANIGPYSQAIITSSESGHADFNIASVSGQIPLIPQTMKLPSSESSSNLLSLQVTLSLQHLWRIGMAIGVGWWTSVVAYLPHRIEDIENNHAPEAALISSQAWSYLHDFNHNDEPREDKDDEAVELDLWENKYHAGMRKMDAQSRVATSCLPDWSLLDSSCKNRAPPPFFAVEVHELPRQSAVEWHAHLGIISGSNKLQITRHTIKQKTDWVIHQCLLDDSKKMQIIAAIPFPRYLEHVNTYLRQIHSYICLLLNAKEDFENENHDRISLFNGNKFIASSSLCYRDNLVSLPQDELLLKSSVSNNIASTTTAAQIPCHRIWDASGQRLAYLCIYNII